MNESEPLSSRLSRVLEYRGSQKDVPPFYSYVEASKEQKEEGIHGFAFTPMGEIPVRFSKPPEGLEASFSTDAYADIDYLQAPAEEIIKAIDTGVERAIQNILSQND